MAHSEGTTVRVHYRGTLDDGSEFDSSTGRDPLEFTVGSGQVIPGFDEAVSGLDVGEETKVRIESENAYGERLDEAVQRVPLDAFAELPPAGVMIQLQTPDGRTLAATVTSVEEDSVELDFNHPLAGQALTFEIELVEIVESETSGSETA